VTGRDPAKAELFKNLLEERDRATAVLVYIIKAAGPTQLARLNAIVDHELAKEK
jgi:hypothetical protein